MEDLEHVVVTAAESRSVNELLDRADRALADGRHAEALDDYERLLRVERLQADEELTSTERRWVERAFFGAATAQDMLGEREAALDLYLRLSERFPEAPTARTAIVRSVRLLVHLERYDEAGARAQRLLDLVDGELGETAAGGHGQLGTLERIALLSAVALDRIVRQDDVGAMRFISRAQQVVDVHAYDRAASIPRDLAQLYYALGEVRRVRAERLTFDPLPKDFALTLEERCQLLLDAQSAYSDVMRAQDAHWSAMAGFRVGELYQKLHEDLMQVKAPASAETAERRSLFEGAMRLRYSILLSKARTMLTHTLAMVERTGQVTRWADKAREAMRNIERAIAAEEAALDRLPYTRAELQEALDHLQEQARGPQEPQGQ